MKPILLLLILITLRAQVLTDFLPFPLASNTTAINAPGELEYTFTPSNNAAFFHLGSR